MRRHSPLFHALVAASVALTVSLSANGAIAVAQHDDLARRLHVANLPVVALSAIGYVKDIGLVSGSTMVYATTDKGIYRSTQPPYSLWTKQSSSLPQSSASPPGQGLISVNPIHPNDLLVDGCRSQDGAQTFDCTGWTSTGGSGEEITALARSPHDPSLVLAGTVGAHLFRSTDDGSTWTQVYTTTEAEEGSSGITAIVVAPRDPTHIVAGEVLDSRNFGNLLLSTDAGQHWHVAEQPTGLGLNLIHPMGLASDLGSGTLWLTWGGWLQRSRDNGQHWAVPLDTQLKLVFDPLGPGTWPDLASLGFAALATHPLTGRLYGIDLDDNATVPSTPWVQTRLVALDRQGHVDAFLPADVNVGDHLAISADGYVFSWWNSAGTFPWDNFGGPGPRYPLTLRSLIGSGNWQLSASLSAAARRVARALLGQPISPTVMCDGAPCQVFDKGAVSQPSHGAYAFVALVPRLLASHATLPVGASTSSLTYRDLAAAHGQRVAPPPGFHGGTQAVRGGVFVPYSASLAPALGFVVPPYFWSYITQARQASHGWQEDFGLPLTNALRARVHKGTEGWREIVVQAFAKAILTYDPRNPPGWRVERANIGLDYAAQFPQAVR